VQLLQLHKPKVDLLTKCLHRNPEMVNTTLFPFWILVRSSLPFREGRVSFFPILPLSKIQKKSKQLKNFLYRLKMNSRDVIQAALLDLQTWSAVLLALINRIREVKFFFH
jgi:hypothetical protein